MEQLVREFLRAVRGARSQVAFSRRLGYRSNVAAEWESGRRIPSASTALSACARTGIDVRAAFERFHRETAALLPAPGRARAARIDTADVAAWLRAHRARVRASEIARRAGFSSVKVSRILSGRTSVSLPDFFSLVSAMTDRVTDLIAALVDIRQLPSAARTHAQLEASRALAFTNPWTSAVLALLETEAYASSVLASESFVAQCLGLSEEAARAALSALVEHGLVKKQRGKHRILRALTIDTRGQAEATRQLRRHWARVGLERLSAPGARDLFSYNVFAVSRADFERARELLQQSFRELRAIISASEPSEIAALLTLHLFEWTPRS